jgi:hypothetical protein
MNDRFQKHKCSCTQTENETYLKTTKGSGPNKKITCIDAVIYLFTRSEHALTGNISYEYKTRMNVDQISG